MKRDIAVIILVNSKNKFLLQKRTLDAPNFPGKWGFFGGGIEKGETEREAVVRETLEEINYKLSNPQLIKKVIINNSKINQINVFSETFDESQKLVLNEGMDYGWFRLSEIKNIDLIPHDKEILLNLNL